MSDYYVNGLRIPSDLYHMICKECERQEAFSGLWPGVHPVILEALYAHFNSVEASYNDIVVDVKVQEGNE